MNSLDISRRCTKRAFVGRWLGWDVGLRPDYVLTLWLVFQDGSLQSHGGHGHGGHGDLDVLRGGVREVAEVAQQRVILLGPGAPAQGQVDKDLRSHVSGIFL